MKMRLKNIKKLWRTDVCSSDLYGSNDSASVNDISRISAGSVIKERSLPLMT